MLEDVLEEHLGLQSTQNEMLKDVLEEYLGLQSTQNDEGYDEQSGPPGRTIQGAQQALQVLIEFIEGLNDLQADYLRGLERLEAVIKAIKINSAAQSTLDRWIT